MQFAFPLQTPVKQVGSSLLFSQKTLLVSLSKEFSVRKLTLSTVCGHLKCGYSAQTQFRTRIGNIYQYVFQHCFEVVEELLVARNSSKLFGNCQERFFYCPHLAQNKCFAKVRLRTLLSTPKNITFLIFIFD